MSESPARPMDIGVALAAAGKAELDPFDMPTSLGKTLGACTKRDLARPSHRSRRLLEIFDRLLLGEVPTGEDELIWRQEQAHQRRLREWLSSGKPA